MKVMLEFLLAALQLLKGASSPWDQTLIKILHLAPKLYLFMKAPRIICQSKADKIVAKQIDQFHGNSCPLAQDYNYLS